MQAIGLLAAGMAAAELPAPAPVPAAEAQQWLRWVIPLPHEAAIERKLVFPAADVKISARAGAGELELNALRLLRDLFRAEAGVDGSAGGSFEILLGVCDATGRINSIPVPDAARLAKLLNHEQAYVIRPVGDNRLVLAALDERGVFYAALTLRQLLEAQFRGEQVTLPLAAVTDWPDLAGRGEWGSMTPTSMHTRPDDIERLARYKMNLHEFHCPHLVDTNGRAIASINPALLRRGRLHAVKMTPIISHLNGMGSRGVYDAYPELRGQGGGALYQSGEHKCYAPCASNPRLIGILADWMRQYAACEGVRDISCWLGELNLRCECPECAKVNQFVLEARAFVRAWQAVLPEYPDLRIHITLSQGSYNVNAEVLAELPLEVGATYYDGSRTYDSSPTPMIYPVLEEYTARGGKLGCYPQLTPSWLLVSPWSAPQFIKYRMTEFVDKKLSAFAGYVVGGNRLFDFNVTAAAEWSWNAHGRSEREFALAWATRQGMPADRAELAADWAVMLGQAAWDLYGARLVSSYLHRPAALAGMVSSGLPPEYGQGLLKYIPDAEHLRKNMETCRTALRLAERVGNAKMLGETRAILTYYEIVNNVVEICEFLAAHQQIGAAELEILQSRMNRLALAGLLNVEALRDWERSESVGDAGSRLNLSIEAAEKSVAAVARVLAKFGVRDPMEGFASRQVGGWTVEDFRAGAEIEKLVEVTDQVSGPGSYRVEFKYTGGHNGLHISQAALIAAPGRDPAAGAEVVVDRHDGVAAARNLNNQYRLDLVQYDPAVKYFLKAAVRGTSPQSQKPGQTGCEGSIWLARDRGLDWQHQLMSIRPGAVRTAARMGFSGQGLKTGVLVGGIGGEGLLELLRAAKGIDAAPVNMTSFQQCHVLIVPQRRDAMPESFARELMDFAHRGGGVISTHDAVGYRAHPKMFENICAGGVEHTRAGTWRVAIQHPLTAGLPVDKPLSRGYVDQVELAAGPEGAVVAVGEATGRPVVIAGQFGKGRYVACGLLPGLVHDPYGEGTREAAPTPDEARLLLNAIRWCAGAD